LFLAEKRILALDLSLIVAGTKYRGQFEERLKTIMKELMENQNAIIFIDELHTLVGAGSAEGSLDAANILKPALSRGEIQCIGATTPAEFRKSIERDRSLERRFQSVKVPPPGESDAIKVLFGIKDRYEKFHAVTYTDEALYASVYNSNRYIPDRFLPDKAIDLIDEAASRLRIEIDSMPQELDENERKIRQLEIERQALKKEKDEASLVRLKKLEEELGNLKESNKSLRLRWGREKDVISRIRNTKAQIEQKKIEESKAEKEGDLGKAAEIRYGTLVTLEKELKQQNQELVKVQKEGSLLKEEVDDQDIAAIVAKWTKIPVSKLLEGETEKLLKIEEGLKGRVVGQDEAIAFVSSCIRRSRTGLSDPHRPIGSFLFVGPTGVGKTELAKSLAWFLFDDENAMVRIDMSEYMEKHSVSRLIGAPPGYVGYDEGGQLTEAVRRKPYAVILFDEVEKAHGDVFNALLQILDDGRLTDGQGRVVNFKNTIIIMTSNIGSEAIRDIENRKEIEKRIHDALKGRFRPEFLNRVDEIIIFSRLRQDDIRRIVDLQIDILKTRLRDREISLDLSDRAKDLLGIRGFDAVYGARPLKRVIQRYVQDAIALKILAGDIKPRDCVTVDVGKDGELSFRTAG
ncbi:MAG: AAA family ATPase, partial [Candidatus Omnitrophota bacterium]|nr:AAA family ATPase [Candidatus Omnitrophota bacterium]